MKRSTFYASAMMLIGLLLMFVTVGAYAQTVPGSATLTWTNPTPANTESAITAIEVHWATAPIADTDLTRAPQVTLTGGPTTTAQTISVANGSTLYFRLRAVNAAGKSPFSAQVSKLISVPVVTGAPTSLTVTISVTP
jgi:predicted phage tail protein